MEDHDMHSECISDATNAVAMEIHETTKIATRVAVMPETSKDALNPAIKCNRIKPNPNDPPMSYVDSLFTVDPLPLANCGSVLPTNTKK